MLEIVMIAASVVLMYRIAEIEQRSGLVWAFLTGAACIGSLFVIPLPLLRIGIALAAVFTGMLVCRIVAKR